MKREILLRSHISRDTQIWCHTSAENLLIEVRFLFAGKYAMGLPTSVFPLIIFVDGISTRDQMLLGSVSNAHLYA